MASTSSTATGGFLSSPRAQRRFLVISGAVLVIGIASFLSVYFRGSASIPQTFSGTAQFAQHQKKAPPPHSVYGIARKFIETAVQRKNLAAAWPLVAKDLKGGQTFKQWMKGNSAVAPYQAENAKTAAFVKDWSYTNQVQFEVDLVAKPGTQAPHTPSHLDWYLGLKKINGRWLVNYWLPYWLPPHQYGGVGGN